MFGTLSICSFARGSEGFASPKNVPIGVLLLPTIFQQSAASCPPSAYEHRHTSLDGMLLSAEATFAAPELWAALYLAALF